MRDAGNTTFGKGAQALRYITGLSVIALLPAQSRSFYDARRHPAVLRSTILKPKIDNPRHFQLANLVL